LSSFMRLRWVAFVVIVVCFGVAYLIGSTIQSELAPMEDRSQFRLMLTAPEGTAYEYMDDYTQQMVQFIMDSVPEYKTALSVTAPGFSGAGAVNSAFVRVTLVDPDDRERSQEEIVNMVSRNLEHFP